jgi:hypothetical protein
VQFCHPSDIYCLAVAGTLTKVGSGRAGFDFTKLGSTGNVLSIQNAAWVINHHNEYLAY